jgi:hypothetical protein
MILWRLPLDPHFDEFLKDVFYEYMNNEFDDSDYQRVTCMISEDDLELFAHGDLAGETVVHMQLKQIYDAYMDSTTTFQMGPWNWYILYEFVKLKVESNNQDKKEEIEYDKKQKITERKMAQAKAKGWVNPLANLEECIAFFDEMDFPAWTYMHFDLRQILLNNFPSNGMYKRVLKDRIPVTDTSLNEIWKVEPKKDYSRNTLR